MKRLLMCLLLLLSLPTLVFAQEDGTGVAAMARHFPADTVLFVSVRTDEEFLNLLDTLSLSGLAELEPLLGDQMPPVQSFSDSLNASLVDAGTDLASVMAWLGDRAAVGLVGDVMQNTASPDFVMAAEVADRASAEALLIDLMDGDFVSAVEGDFTVFSPPDGDQGGYIAVSDDLLLFGAGAFSSRAMDETSLNSNPLFQQAVGALPASGYNLLMYADPSSITSALPVDATGSFTVESAPLAVGFTILDDRSFIIDSAQLPLPGAGDNAPARIDPAFAQFIPGNASAVIHATDLNSLITNATAFADLLTTDANAPLPSQQIEQMFAMFGFDLEADLLSWWTGDYALFLRTDMDDMIAATFSPQIYDYSQLSTQLDVGVIIEATDPAKAQALVTRLDALLTQMTAGVPGVTVSNDTLSGVAVTVVSLDVPIDPQTTISLELVTGVTDSVFFLATRPAAETILSGDGMLPNNPIYIDAGQYMLPNPTSIAYADGEGLIVSIATSTIIPLALLGPAIGNVFDNVVADLQTGMVTTPTPMPTVTPTVGVAVLGMDAEAFLAQVQAALMGISGSISATVTDDGVNLLRFVISGAPQ